MSGPAKLLLILFLATLAGPRAAAARDLDNASDMLALAYLGDRVLDVCGFAGDGRGNAIRSAATYYRERIEDAVLDNLNRRDSERVTQAARSKADQWLGRLAEDKPEAAGARQGAGAWCSDKGEAAIEAIARIFHASQQDQKTNVVAAKE